MALCARVESLLKEASVPYEIFAHREVFTAQEVAQSSHVPGRMMAKVVVLKDADDRFLMAVLPATRKLDLDSRRPRIGSATLTLASEREMRDLFPDCEVGAEPPFGRLYGIATYLDGCFAEERDICFQAGNHHEAVRMKFQDYLTLASPLAGNFCLHRTLAGADA